MSEHGSQSDKEPIELADLSRTSEDNTHIPTAALSGASQRTASGNTALLNIGEWQEQRRSHSFSSTKDDTTRAFGPGSNIADSPTAIIRHGQPARGGILDHAPRAAKTPVQIIRELTVEVFPALLISVAGSVTPAFDRVPALFIMVPVLLNLKSSIELNMSTRLSTLANLGRFDNKKDRFASMLANCELLLLHGDASTSAIAWFSLLSLLLAVGIGCTVVGCAVIGLLTCVTVRLSHHFGIDPDNIGTPITSSFGDMSTLLILGLVSSIMLRVMDTIWPLVAAIGCGALGVVLFRMVRKNPLTAHHIKEGWPPLVFAAVTSSVAGVLVEAFAERYPGMPALVPVVNGIGGNIGTVFASRLSTSLHRGQGSAKESNLVMCILLMINVPIQIGYLVTVKFFNTHGLDVTAWFFLVYTLATLLHVVAILLVAKVTCSLLWSRGYDPDDYVNPLVTGTGDMLGTSLLLQTGVWAQFAAGDVEYMEQAVAGAEESHSETTGAAVATGALGVACKVLRIAGQAAEWADVPVGKACRRAVARMNASVEESVPLADAESEAVDA
ncbi:hypothetical protein DL89DRAFT_324395 [Linderina pennispora]|uniref:SLC41A/MgtE integral membrane domain-containing protein n=1 Tax=Linderina pennispora TaxID=61395 RepID=A0A1Y1W3C0_9FUNG|nr:uncharacterized protein DL89DRAFT_324395 [Linderina pennispora]ORX67654.1 hypothetical protein DL89DRAFT_324395 [Linderina pennispora]